MSKKYVILTCGITNVGGGQIYCKNKIKYCKSQGFDTYIFSPYNGKIIIKDLEKFSSLIIKALDFFPTIFNERTTEKTIEKILKGINYCEDDEVIIESHTEELALWGEMVAKRIKAKHIVYLLTESFDELSDYVFKFLDFKYSRKELACIDKIAMQKMFAPYKKLLEEECFFLKATLGVPVEDIEIPDEYIEKCKNKKVIGIIGRGGKNYVYQAVKDACDFANKHKEDKFVLLVIGSIVDGFYQKQQKCAKNCVNVELVFTDNQFPIPKKMLHLMDVCFAAAGCVRPPYYEGIPTITMDVYDNKPIGVMGYDTFATLSRKKELNKPKNYYLEEIIYGNFIKENEFTAPEPIDFDKAYDVHFKFIEDSSKQKEYYEFNNVVLTKKEKIWSLLSKIGGVKLIRWIRKLRRKH